MSRLWARVHLVSPFGGRLAMTMGANLLLAVISLGTGVLAARLLGPTGRGELAAIQTWPIFLGALATLGLPDATVYFSARDPEHAGRYMGSGVLLTLIASVPFVIAGYLLMPLLLAAQDPQTVEGARLYLLVIPVLSVMGMSYHPLRGRNDLAAWNVLRTLPTVGWLLLLLAAGATGHATARWLANGYLIVLAALIVPMHAVVKARLRASLRPETRHFRPMLRYGLSSIAGAVPQMLNARVDQMLMVGLLAPKSLGLYAIAVAWSGAIAPIVTAIGGVLFPRVASQTTEASRVASLAQGTRLGGAVTLSAALLVLLITPFAVPLLFGMDFAAAVPSALVLVVAAAFGGMNVTLEEGARGLGHPIVVLWSEGVGVVAGMATLLLLLPSLGILGAAIASVVGYGATSAVLVLQLRRITGCGAGVLLLPRHEDWRLIRGRLAQVVAG